MSEIQEKASKKQPRMLGRLRLRTALVAVACVLVVAGIAARIVCVNTTTPKIPLQHFDQGEWVPLEGAFQDSNMDDTDGYSLNVEGATICTYDEYLTRHGVEPEEPGAHGDAKCIVDVAINVRNEGDSTGGLDMFNMVLISSGLNEYYICDSALWALVQEGAADKVAIRSGTEFTMHVPYVNNTTGPHTYLYGISGDRFWLLASRMPVRKMIEVRVDG